MFSFGTSSTNEKPLDDYSYGKQLYANFGILSNLSYIKGRACFVILLTKALPSKIKNRHDIHIGERLFPEPTLQMARRWDSQRII